MLFVKDPQHANSMFLVFNNLIFFSSQILKVYLIHRREFRTLQYELLSYVLKFKKTSGQSSSRFRILPTYSPFPPIDGARRRLHRASVSPFRSVYKMCDSLQKLTFISK